MRAAPPTTTAPLALLAGAALAGAACTGAPSQVPCTAAEQCALDGRAGRCETTGWCSFADVECASGRRYVAHYAGPVSETCVPREVPDWAVVIGGVTVDELDQLALGADGRLYAFGRFFDSLSSPQSLDGAGNYDLLVAALSAQDGAVRWLLPLGSSLGDTAGGLGLSGSLIHVAGRFTTVLNVLGIELRKGDPAQAFGAFHAVLEDKGAPELRAAAVTLGDGTASPSDVDGAAAVGEWQGGAIDFTASTPGDAVSATGTSAWLAATSDGSWGQTATLVPASASAEIRATAASFDGEGLTFAGRYTGAINFGGASLLPAAQQSDGYLATWLPATPGAAPAVTLLRGAGPDGVTALARAGAEVVAAGYATSAVTIAGVATSPLGVQDAVAFGSRGGLRPWRLGVAGGATTALAIAAGAGGVIVAGTYDRALRIGDTALPHRGGLDAFVACVRNDGSVVWARSFGGLGDDAPAGVAQAADGRVVLGLTFTGTIELGAGATRTAVGDSDWLILAFEP